MKSMKSIKSIKRRKKDSFFNVSKLNLDKFKNNSSEAIFDYDFEQAKEFSHYFIHNNQHIVLKKVKKLHNKGSVKLKN